ncbi:tail fiber protein, partial [Pirellulales bacterium]|nr:tail fiber protein [Pirellulales bacterium]
MPTNFRIFAVVVSVATVVGISPAVGVAATTGAAGGGQRFDSEQPSLALNYVVNIVGADDDLGEVGMFAGTFAPQGWALAQGQILSIQSYSALHDKLGTSFGGDGQSTFALPDLRGRTPIGAGSGPGLPSYNLGQFVGDDGLFGVTPSHNHAIGTAYSTLPAGQSTHSNLQPSLALHPIIATTGTYPSPSVVANTPPALGGYGAGDGPYFGTNDEPYLAEITWIAHDEPPPGWRLANGDTLDIADHQALFSIVGTMYGGDGEVTFRLPDLRGRTAVGTGSGPGLTPRASGQSFGAPDEVLNTTHTPSHVHALPNGAGNTGPSGLGAAQSNLQPSLAVTHLIALEGTYPTENVVSNHADGSLPSAIGSGTNPYYASVSMFAGNYAPRGFAK